MTFFFSGAISYVGAKLFFISTHNVLEGKSDTCP